MNATKVLQLLNANNLTELRRLCEFEVCGAKYKNPDSAKARERLAKKVAKEKQKSHPALAGAYVIEKTQQICNGYAGAVYNDILAGLFTPPAGTVPLDVRGVFPLWKDRKYYPAAIDLQDLKARSKLAAIDGIKLKKQLVQIGGVYYSAELLFDFLPTLTGNISYWQRAGNGRFSSFGACGDNGEVIIMPVRVKDEWSIKPLRIY